MRASRAITRDTALSCRAAISSPSPIRTSRADRPSRTTRSSNDMSLLLEALKKAEKAKEEAQRKARGEAEGAMELRLEGDAPAPARTEPVLTRDQLPDIRQPLQIEDAAPPTPKQPEAPPPAAAEAAARKVFEAKFKEPNPKLPFYITVGALGVFRSEEHTSELQSPTD